ncbi:MAG: hypothetical protein KY444_10885, partial [Gemmatimonadetes bacterium]|nr:hypothetical protein [Gemmatimonadota bacterium]
MDTAPDLVEAARLAARGSDIAVLGACAFAVAKGGRLVVTVAAVVVAARLLGLLCMAAAGPVAPTAAFAIEAALLLYLLWIALFSRPYWVLFTAAFQLLIVISCGAGVLTESWSGKQFAEL